MCVCVCVCACVCVCVCEDIPLCVQLSQCVMTHSLVNYIQVEVDSNVKGTHTSDIHMVCSTCSQLTACSLFSGQTSAV